MAQLTQAFIERTKPAAKPRTIADGGTGLYLLVHPTGKKVFIWRWRIPLPDGTSRWSKITIGAVNEIDLDDARDLAISYKKAVKAGRDPQLEQKRDKAKVALTVASAWKLFDNVVDGLKPRTQSEYRRIWNKDIKPVIGSTLITAITRDDLELLVGKVHDRAKCAGLITHAVLSSFMGWCAGRGRLSTGLQINAMAGAPKPSDAPAERERYLHPDELKWLLRAFHGLRGEGGNVGRWATALEVLLRTGQRLDNIVSMKDGAVRSGVLTVGKADFKGNRLHEVPLPPQVLKLIAAADRPDKGDRIFQRLHHQNDAIKAIRERAETLAGGEFIDHWRPHDFRRTFNTLMLDEYDDADYFTIEAILGHKIKGVAKHYNFAKVMKKKERHLLWWNAFLDGLAVEEEQQLAA